MADHTKLTDAELISRMASVVYLDTNTTRRSGNLWSAQRKGAVHQSANGKTMREALLAAMDKPDFVAKFQNKGKVLTPSVVAFDDDEDEL